MEADAPQMRGRTRQVELLAAVRGAGAGYDTTGSQSLGTRGRRACFSADWWRKSGSGWSPVGPRGCRRQPILAPDETHGRRNRMLVASITAALEDPGVLPRSFLLHGVTGSGKTEVYLRSIAHAVAQGKQAIYLVPEISLTPQTVGMVNDRFPGRVAVLHHRLTERQRFEQWWNIRDGLADVIVGPRSALFAPAVNLGISRRRRGTRAGVQAGRAYLPIITRATPPSPLLAAPARWW